MQFRHRVWRLCGLTKASLNGANSWALPRLTTSWQELASVPDVCSVSTFLRQSPLLQVWPLSEQDSPSVSYPMCKPLFRQNGPNKNRDGGGVFLFHWCEVLDLGSDETLEQGTQEALGKGAEAVSVL